MSTVALKFCDRCGKPVPDNKIPWLIMPYTPGNANIYRFEDMTKDLCDDCISSINDWLSCDSVDKLRLINNYIKEKWLPCNKT